MSLYSQDDEDDSKYKKYTFETSVTMSTYLLAVTVTDFKNIKTSTSKGVEVRQIFNKSAQVFGPRTWCKKITFGYRVIHQDTV